MRVPTPSVFRPYEDCPSGRSLGQEDGWLEGWLELHSSTRIPMANARFTGFLYGRFMRNSRRFVFNSYSEGKARVVHLVNRRGDGRNCGHDAADDR